MSRLCGDGHRGRLFNVVIGSRHCDSSACKYQVATLQLRLTRLSKRRNINKYSHRLFIYKLGIIFQDWPNTAAPASMFPMEGLSVTVIFGVAFFHLHVRVWLALACVDSVDRC